VSKLFEDLKEGLEEAIAYNEGKVEGAFDFTSVHNMDCSDIKIDKTPLKYWETKMKGTSNCIETENKKIEKLNNTPDTIQEIEAILLEGSSTFLQYALHHQQKKDFEKCSINNQLSEKQSKALKLLRTLKR
jgi:hypothetical protein